MQLLVLLTADHAYTDNVTGKLYVLGSFNRILPTQFPHRHDKMAVVIRIASEVADLTDEQRLTGVLMDEDGREILKFQGPVVFPIASDGSRPYLNLIIELAGIVFPQPGKYEFRVRVGDVDLGSTPIDVVKSGQ